ncbi:hypothetical protein [Streptomyces gobiensis]|uniref:hypothetical protein n=1 Tax=Streptomyces gobiensis TaxID=2875706 RepID=UPI001E2E9364|nr:hypothetical protein [Streptomyces gobiensis]UGY91979.1 hypothetical protein test1122_09770 [Streptomyces gobiensis]
MRLRSLPALCVSAVLAAGAMVVAAPAASANEGPTPAEFVEDGGEIKICTRGTLFDGMTNFGCRAPHTPITEKTTWKELRQEEDAVAPMLCKPSLANELIEITEWYSLGAGAAVQCTPVPHTWGP